MRAAAVELPRGLRINAVSPSMLTESKAAFGPLFFGASSRYQQLVSRWRMHGACKGRRPGVYFVYGNDDLCVMCPVGSLDI